MIIRKLEALFSFKHDLSGLNTASSKIDNFASKAKMAVGALAGFAAVNGLKNFMDSTAEAADHIGKTAYKLGLSVEALQEFRFAAEQSGVATNTFEMALQRFSRRAAEAANGTGEAKAALEELGISLNDSSGNLRDPAIMINEVADSIAGIDVQSDRIRLAMKLFDTGGVDMIKMLQGGSKGMKDLRLEAQELGFVLSKESTDNAANYNDSMNRMSKAVGGLTQSISTKLMPIYTTSANFIARSAAKMHVVIEFFNELNKKTTIVRTAFIALGIILSALATKLVIALAPAFMAMLPAIAMFAAIGAAIGALALIIDDLWVGFKGGNSVVLNLVNNIKGWVTNKLGKLWNFLPTSLQDNLKSTAAFARQGFEKILAFVQIVKVRAIGILKSLLKTTWLVMTKVSQVVLDALSKLFDGWASFIIGGLDKVFSMARSLIIGITKLWDNALPDFVKKGFSAAIDFVGGIGSEYDKKPSQAHLAPQMGQSINYLQNQSKQSVNVSVNVKSGANPHEIGGEVSRVIRKELERERQNAFMGVSQYAG